MTILQGNHKYFEWEITKHKDLEIRWKQFRKKVNGKKVAGKKLRFPSRGTQGKHISWYQAWSFLCRDVGLIEIKPEEIGAMTDAPIVAVSTLPDDVYWYQQYMVNDPIEDLRSTGKIVLEYATDNMSEDEERTANKLTELLQLPVIRLGRLGKRYATGWGHKTPIGLLCTICDFLHKEEETYTKPTLAIRAELAKELHAKLFDGTESFNEQTIVVENPDKTDRVLCSFGEHAGTTISTDLCYLVQAILTDDPCTADCCEQVPIAAFYKWLLFTYPRFHKIWKYVVFDDEDEIDSINEQVFNAFDKANPKHQFT